MNLKNHLIILAACCMTYACTNKVDQNPFLSDFKTEFGAPDFKNINFEHYEPAFVEGIKQHTEEIQRIIEQTAPTFENTIVALDRSGEVLTRVSNVFFNMTSAETTPELTNLSMEIAPMLSEHFDNVYLNKELFEKVNQVYEQVKENPSQLTREQQRLLDKYYKAFVRAGAALDEQKQERLKEINKEAATLEITFSNNVLNENNNYQLIVEDASELSGLPDWFVQSAAEEAASIGKEGAWLFTLHNPSRLPFLQYADNRELRKQIYTAYINRGNQNDANDNKKILNRIIQLRHEKANLLGFDNYADFVLDVNMAKNSQTVMDFLNNLWGYALTNSKKELVELQRIMDKEGKGEKIEGWDWWYYAEKLRQEKYDLNEDELKPYFKLENVRDGVFAVANKLYGITLHEIKNAPVYHEDVTVFEVKDADGSHLGLFYADYFPRAGKRGGAWMSNYREQVGEVRPIICNVGNFTKPTSDMPSLLTLDEVETLFHEFGHGLHGMLSKCNYAGVAGTNVALDFVELPSQVLEHWATTPEVLKMYARHYETGEVIPDELIEKILKQKTFNQGFITTELLAAAILDMNLHTLTDTDNLNVIEFEKKSMDKLGLIPEIAPRYRVTYFNHIIGMYAAGYYSYLWANVLDADAFEAFKENGIFDAKTALAFRSNVLEKGNSEDPMVLYRNFRGADPKLEPMLKNRGMQ